MFAALRRTCLAAPSTVQRCSSSLTATAPPAAFSRSHSSRRTYVTEIWKNTKSSELGAALARTKDLYKTYKPITPSIRHLRRPLNPHLYAGRPLRSLTLPKRKNGGRNGHGIITVRHRGGGHKQRIRLIDYKREAPGIHDVVRIEYDPNRSAHIALLHNRDPKSVGDQKWSYIIATEGMRAGDEVQSFRQGIPADFLESYGIHTTTTTSAHAPKPRKSKGSQDSTPQSREEAAAAAEAEAVAAAAASAQNLALGLLRSMTLKPGNVLPLHLIPPGTVINTVSLTPTGPGILCRSAGAFGQVVAVEEGAKYVQVRLQSGEVRKILRDCCATIGKVSNPLWKNRSLGKAGRSRWLGIRPSVRGMAMNANDHPHGGGRGKSKSNKHPVSIWGWGTKGTRTRKPGPKGPKNSNKMVIRERPRGKEKRGLA
ncbi:translation protein SH3-like domain-containing protein [Gymnopilus junonius]|uniref:Large ribosomal subunit protein uL2m n=1 Tax=Gymnopilus junonius TaxID=109634 RepID=A0A9P5NLJ6_GYMJU|nr:translation protein SH3-like domain-containing protein [Gymnopilus junonius]